MRHTTPNIDRDAAALASSQDSGHPSTQPSAQPSMPPSASPLTYGASYAAQEAAATEGFYAWFMRLCAQRHVDPTTVARACGFSHATITHWRKTGAAPQPTTCRVIATYFGEPYLLALQQAGHITSDDLRLSRDPETLRLQMRLDEPTARALGADERDSLPAPEDPTPFTDHELVARAKVAIAQVPGLPQEAIANLSQLIDLYTTAAQTMRALRPHDDDDV